MAADRRDGATAPAQRAQATIPNGPQAPREARACVKRWLDGQVDQRILDDAVLLISELVTNSVRHAQAVRGAPLLVSADLDPGVLRLEVGDTGRGGVVARRAPDLRNGSGFGLHLIDALAARWGIDHVGGTQVWCELIR
jgi:anti-sigma regulatory factor (Ser/Thr protein kinase)